VWENEWPECKRRSIQRSDMKKTCGRGDIWTVEKLLYFYDKEALFNTYSTAYSDSILIGRWACSNFQERPNIHRSMLVRQVRVTRTTEIRIKVNVWHPRRCQEFSESHLCIFSPLCNIYICAFVYLAYETWTYRNRKQEI